MEFVNCALCSSNKTKTILEFENPASGKAKLNLVRCEKCSLVYLNPRLEKNELKNYYSKAYYSKGSQNSFYKNLLINKRAKKVISLVKKGRILDLGSGNLDFLSTLKRENLDLFALEPSENGFKVSKESSYGKIKLEEGFLEARKYPKEYFDLLTLWHVFEHFHSPREELKQINMVLKKGGFLLMAFPISGSLDTFFSKRAIYGPSSLVHLYYWNKKTVKKILEEEGFKVLELKFPLFDNFFSLYPQLKLKQFIPYQNKFFWLVSLIFLSPLSLIFGFASLISNRASNLEVLAQKI